MRWLGKWLTDILKWLIMTRFDLFVISPKKILLNYLEV